MLRRVTMILSTLAVFTALPAAHAGRPSWRTLADCAVGYHIDALDKALNRQRAPGMQRMILGQSRDYENAAIRLYMVGHKVSRASAQRSVHSYMNANDRRFMAMRKAGKLEGFIDVCPQIPTR